MSKTETETLCEKLDSIPLENWRSKFDLEGNGAIFVKLKGKVRAEIERKNVYSPSGYRGIEFDDESNYSLVYNLRLIRRKFVAVPSLDFENIDRVAKRIYEGVLKKAQSESDENRRGHEEKIREEFGDFLKSGNQKRNK